MRLHLRVALDDGRDAVHQLVDQVNHAVGRHLSRLDDRGLLPAAVETDLSLGVLRRPDRLDVCGRSALSLGNSSPALTPPEVSISADLPVRV